MVAITWHIQTPRVARGGEKMRMPAKMSLPYSWGPRPRQMAVVDVWDDVCRAQTWEACYNERATLTRIEAFADTEPRLAENTHGQEQGNCGQFWCAYNFKVVAWISTGKYLKGMYGIGLTSALIQEVLRNSGISEQSLDYSQKYLMLNSCWRHNLFPVFLLKATSRREMGNSLIGGMSFIHHTSFLQMKCTVSRWLKKLLTRGSLFLTSLMIFTESSSSSMSSGSGGSSGS